MYSPISLLRAQVHELARQHDLARRSFEDARAELEQRIPQDPEDHRFHSSLGIAYAGLGRRGEAVREARSGCDLMPVSKDALLAILRVEDLVVVFDGGEIRRCDRRAGRPAVAQRRWTPHVLRLDPRWDPLRSDPRFQALLKKYEVKE